MASLRQSLLRVPEQWSASWFRLFATEVIAPASDAAAQAMGEAAAAATAQAVAAHDADPFAHENVVAVHVAQADPHPQYARASSDVVADPAGGAVVDTECRARLADLLAALRAAGVIAT